MDLVSSDPDDPYPQSGRDAQWPTRGRGAYGAVGGLRAPHGDMLDDKLVMVGTLWGERERGGESLGELL